MGNRQTYIPVSEPASSAPTAVSDITVDAASSAACLHPHCRAKYCYKETPYCYIHALQQDPELLEAHNEKSARTRAQTAAKKAERKTFLTSPEHRAAVQIKRLEKQMKELEKTRVRRGIRVIPFL